MLRLQGSALMVTDERHQRRAEPLSLIANDIFRDSEESHLWLRLDGAEMSPVGVGIGRDGVGDGGCWL